MSSSFDVHQYVRAWRERLAAQESREHDRALYLRQVAQDCARHLVQEFGAHKVYLFGSLVQGDLIHARSDIDLAVEGLEGRLYWKALSALWALLPAGTELDLVRLEHAWPGLAKRVRAEGELLDAAA